MSNQDMKIAAKIIEQLPSIGLSSEDKQYWIEHLPKLQHALSSVLVRNHLPFHKNRNGHYTLTLIGKYLLGEEEVMYLRRNDIDVNPFAQSMLESTFIDSYNAQHLLQENQKCKIALIPSNEIKKENRTTIEVQRACARIYGYQIPQAGIVPRICEVVSDDEMRQMEFNSIFGLHSPILDQNGDASFLCARRIGDSEVFLDSYFVSAESTWHNDIAFAFIDPAH